MREFLLRIECENDAFRGGNWRYEVARLLRLTADRMLNERGETSFRLMDGNGNTVGRAELRGGEG